MPARSRSLADLEGRAEGAGPREASLGGAIRLSVEIPIRVLSILTTLVLTHRLGVLGFGEFIVVLGVALVLAEFADLGLTQSLIPSTINGSRTVRDIYAAKAGLTAVALVLGALAVRGFAALDLDPSLLGLCGLHYIGVSWIECAGNTLRAKGRGGQEALLLLSFRCGLIGLIGLTGLGDSIDRVAWAYALSILPGLLLGAALVGRQGLGARTTGVPGVLREALPLGINSALARFTVRIEVFALHLLGMLTELGLFAVCLRIIESVLTLPTALAGGALPALAREASGREKDPGAAQRTLGLVAWAAVPAALGLGLRAPEVLSLLGPGFVEAAPLLRVSAFSMALAFMNTTLFHVLIAAARGSLIPKLTAARLLAGLGFASLLVPRFGGSGAAFGFAASELLLLSLLVSSARRSAGFSLVRPLGAALLGSTPMTLVLLAGPRSLGLAIPLALLAFAAGAFVTRKWRPHLAGLD